MDTHIIPVELQQLHATAQSTRSLLDTLEHEFASNRLVQGPKYAPFGRGVDRFSDFSG